MTNNRNNSNDNHTTQPTSAHILSLRYNHCAILLVSQGHTSMKVWRELGLWYTIVNDSVAQNVSEGEGK